MWFVYQRPVYPSGTAFSKISKLRSPSHTTFSTAMASLELMKTSLPGSNHSKESGTSKSSVGQLKRLTHATCWSDEISGKRDDRTGGSPVNILGRNELPGAAAYPAVHLWQAFPWNKLIKAKHHEHWSRFIPEACLDLCLIDPFELKKCCQFGKTPIGPLTTTWSIRIPELSHSSSGCQSLAFSSFSSRVFRVGKGESTY